MLTMANKVKTNKSKDREEEELNRKFQSVHRPWKTFMFFTGFCLFSAEFAFFFLNEMHFSAVIV